MATCYRPNDFQNLLDEHARAAEDAKSRAYVALSHSRKSTPRAVHKKLKRDYQSACNAVAVANGYWSFLGFNDE